MSGGSSINPQVAFGKALRSFRLSAGLTQEQLSLESGVQRNFISLIETGQNQPTVSTIFRLAFALSTPPSRLIAEAEKNLNHARP
jgi:transcriptional regulator with XRE-family HTH domain